MAIDVSKLKVYPMTGKARGGGFALILNPMNAAPTAREGFGPFDTEADAIKFHDAEMVAPYDDSVISGEPAQLMVYRKCFRKDGPLEWMNPLLNHQRTAPDKETGLGVWRISFQPIEWDVKLE